MAATNDTLIKMEGVKKVFMTDEVETHALEEIHLEIKKGTYISIAGPVRLRQIDAAVDSWLARFAEPRQLRLNGQPVANLSSASARASAIARSASSSRHST